MRSLDIDIAGRIFKKYTFALKIHGNLDKSIYLTLLLFLLLDSDDLSYFKELYI